MMTETEMRVLRLRLKQFYEGSLTEGQQSYFNVKDRVLIPTPMGRHWLAEHLKLYSNLLSLAPGEKLLDVGCGEGYYTQSLANECGRAIGLDMSYSVLELLKGLKTFNPARVPIVNGDVETLALASESIDKAICSHVLEHVLDDRAVLNEIHRVLKPGGIAVLGVPLKYSWQHRLLWGAIGVGRAVFKPGKKGTPMARAGQLDVALVGKQAHIRHYNVSAFRALVESSNFKIAKLYGMWFHDPGNWFVYFTQPNRVLYAIGTSISKRFPQMGAGLVAKCHKI